MVAKDEGPIAAEVRRIYAKNCFMMDFFHIDIDEIHCGNVTVSMKIEHDKHANHRNVVHGGVLTALADAVTGVTCCSVGDMAVTVSSTMNFIRNIEFGHRARVVSHITHHGRTTIVMTADMYDDQNRLMANILATMMVVGHFDGIPAKW